MQYQGISEDDSFKGEQIMLKKQYLVGFKRFRYNSVLIRNFLVMTVFEILLVCLLISIFFHQIKKNISDEIYDMNYMELVRTGETLDTIVAQIENFAYYLTMENDIKLLMLEAYERDFDERAEDGSLASSLAVSPYG